MKNYRVCCFILQPSSLILTFHIFRFFQSRVTIQLPASMNSPVAAACGSGAVIVVVLDRSMPCLVHSGVTLSVMTGAFSASVNVGQLVSAAASRTSSSTCA